ncbi:DUF58 domain-containing protein [Paenibacillus sp.]|uniref:DUF58 domain-containing protein n=1 Tax=Paenibacillus sp. TaxID=58172 RepID=UPI002D2FA640|nr:DUF58 domain-containing protein [Paenibacillus sp.]HZG88325.1 DUF58 domain-containing protein [Paenibacillus sp.]
MMRMHRFAALALWALLGWGMAARGGFTLHFLFYTYTCIVGYGWLIRWIGLRGVRVERVVRAADGSTPPEGAFDAGEEAVVVATIRRSFALPLPWLVVRERIGEFEYDLLHGPWLTSRTTFSYLLPLPERGVYRFEPAALWTGDPFGVVPLRTTAAGAGGDVVVAPKARLLGPEAEEALRRLAAAGNGAARREGDERTELRAYRDGDPLSRVLWKLAARSDEWLVRVPEAKRRMEETLVLVDAAGADAEAVDACAETAAGVVAALAALRRPFRLLAIGGAAARASASAPGWRRALAELSPAAPDAPLPPANPAGGVVCVCAALRPQAAALCRGARASGREAAVLLVGGGEAGGGASSVAASGSELAAQLARFGVSIATEGGRANDESRTAVSS